MAMTEGDDGRPGVPNWTGVERAGNAAGRQDEPVPATAAVPSAPPPPPSAVDVLRVIADRLAALEHLVAGMAGVDPTPDTGMVSALAERNEQLADALLARVDERLRSLADAIAGLSVGAGPDQSSSLALRLDALDRRLDALESFTTATPSWLPEVFAAIAEAKAAPAAAAATPPWVGQLAQDLRSLRASLARMVG